MRPCPCHCHCHCTVKVAGMLTVLCALHHTLLHLTMLLRAPALQLLSAAHTSKRGLVSLLFHTVL